jgi:hypothetical protein
MNTHTKQIIRGLRKRIAALESENQQLRSDMEHYSNSADYAQRQAEESNHAAHQASQRAARARREAEEAESAAESRRWEQRRVTGELERSRSWGDKWGVDRALERLKRL